MDQSHSTVRHRPIGSAHHSVDLIEKEYEVLQSWLGAKVRSIT